MDEDEANLQFSSDEEESSICYSNNNKHLAPNQKATLEN